MPKHTYKRGCFISYSEDNQIVKIIEKLAENLLYRFPYRIIRYGSNNFKVFL
jgi:hypothetical protein